MRYTKSCIKRTGVTEMDKVTPEAFQTFLWVAAALVAFALAVWTLVDKIKNAASWRKSVEERLKNDKERIDNHDTGQRALLRGVLALLNHELHNGNNDEMERAKSGIDNFLIEK